MNILFMSNSLTRRYGYSVVADQISDCLQKSGNQIFFLGMQNVGPPWVRPNGVVQLGLRYDPWCSDSLEDYANVFHADCMLTMFDVWLNETAYLSRVRKKLDIPWVLHMTVNSSPLSPMLAARAVDADIVVVPSRYNFSVLNEGGFGDRTVYIPHGCDTSVFKPMPEAKEEMRKRLRIEDKEFVVLCVNRNKGMQKRLCDIIKSWKLLLEKEPKLKKEGVLLMLHDPFEGDGFRTDYLRDRIMVSDTVRYIWAKPSTDYNGMIATYEGDRYAMRHNANINFSAEEMAKIYNVADIHVVPCQGESFSLPVLESMACGVPNIMGNHSTGPELIGESNAGLLVDVVASETTQLISDISVLNLDDMTNKMLVLYKDEELRKRCGENALKHAQKYDWKYIRTEWVKLMDKVRDITLQCDYSTGRLGV